MMTNYEDDIPLSTARAAHAGTSFDPEKRGEQERAGYAATLTQDRENLARYATTPEKLATLAAEFARYREGYRARMLKLLATQSRAMSWMIAGPSKFLVARQQKIQRVEDKRLGELVEFRKRALDAIRKILTPELAPIMAGDADATERLKAKLGKAEAAQARNKAINAAIRKHAKAGPTAQVVALVGLGIPERLATELLKPDFAGRTGIADYELVNNGAEIRRLKKRLEAVGRSQAAPVVESEGADGIRIEDCPPDNRIRLFFPGKPVDGVRDGLKARGFRWTPSLGCWQAYRNTRSLEHARTFAGAP